MSMSRTLVAHTDPDKPMVLRFALAFWVWPSFRRLLAEIAPGQPLTESRGLLWRYFYLHGPLLFLFDVREVLIHTQRLDSELLEPGEETRR